MSILVVMDDDVEARLTAYLLGQVDGDVAIAPSIADARQRVAHHTFSAVILDTRLPDGDGFTLLHILGESDFDGAALVVSAAKGLALKVRALDEGADDYIVRPYEPAEFLARVRAATRRARRRASRAESGVLRVGPVQLNTNELKVALPGGRHATLTPNEMRVLHYLMKHERRVVSHKELSRLLFGLESYPGYSNAVGVYIRRVRHKIEEDVGNPRLIVTVRGNGYQFVVPEMEAIGDRESAPKTWFTWT